MALSSILRKDCPTCGKKAIEASRVQLGQTTLVTLVCKHSYTEQKISAGIYDSIVSSDKRSLMPYQIDGVKFAEKANGRCLIADEQGLGKTIQALALLKLHPEMLPALIVTKTTIKLQWHLELIRWCGTEGFLCQTINSSKEKAMPAFDVFVSSYDLTKVDGMFEYVNIKTLIIDECQAIKNHLADRSKAIQKIAANCEHVIGLSGTPIKNHAGEYFTILNMLRPAMFPEYQRYINTWCDSYENGYQQKIGGLRNPKLFKEVTQDFIIRRTKDEVLPDLPPFSRKFFHCELDRKLNKSYAKLLEELEEQYYAEDDNRAANMLAIMNKLRWVTGISKVEGCAEFLIEFLTGCDRQIVVFLHHHDVHTKLQAELDSWLVENNLAKTLNLISSLDGNARAQLVEKFKNGESRVMIASTLSSGEGLNLQFCADGIMLERQWNPPNEEQAEARFHRFGQVNPVSVTYMIASETIDEYFTELVEQKRAIIKSTVDGKEIQWDQTSLLNELAGILVSKGKKKWSL